MSETSHKNLRSLQNDFNYTVEKHWSVFWYMTGPPPKGLKGPILYNVNTWLYVSKWIRHIITVCVCGTRLTCRRGLFQTRQISPSHTRNRGGLWTHCFAPRLRPTCKNILQGCEKKKPIHCDQPISGTVPVRFGYRSTRSERHLVSFHSSKRRLAVFDFCEC